ncbi:hypothetical protein MPER_07289, partial [Moniliophthora perniciosa FA553]
EDEERKKKNGPSHKRTNQHARTSHMADTTEPPPAPVVTNSNFYDPSSFAGGCMGRLYSFFQNYGQGCLTSRNCQAQIMTVDGGSTRVNVYSLSTVASTWQLSVNEQGVANQADGIDGFASTLTAWSSS